MSTQEFDRIKKTGGICDVCGKPYEFRLKVTYHLDGKKECEHDYGEALLYFTNSEKKLADKLIKEGKLLVKGSDGITRICEPVRDKYGKIVKRKRKYF